MRYLTGDWLRAHAQQARLPPREPRCSKEVEVQRKRGILRMETEPGLPHLPVPGLRPTFSCLYSGEGTVISP